MSATKPPAAVDPPPLALRRRLSFFVRRFQGRRHGLVRLGGGPVLTRGAANHPLVVEHLLAVAEAEGIPV